MQGVYCGVSAIFSHEFFSDTAKRCTATPTIVHPDGGGMICPKCKETRLKKGGSSPSTAIGRWVPKLSRAIERRSKAELTIQDKEDAKSFKNTKNLSKDGERLRSEAIAQLVYFKTMEGLDKDLKNKTYKLAAADSSPGLSSLFASAEQLCRDNPNFCNSVVIAMLQGAVAKSLHGKRAQTNERKTVKMNAKKFYVKYSM